MPPGSRPRKAVHSKRHCPPVFLLNSFERNSAIYPLLISAVTTHDHHDHTRVLGGMSPLLYSIFDDYTRLDQTTRDVSYLMCCDCSNGNRIRGQTILPVCTIGGDDHDVSTLWQRHGMDTNGVGKYTSRVDVGIKGV